VSTDGQEAAPRRGEDAAGAPSGSVAEPEPR
jgi:hypothetical protein